MELDHRDLYRLPWSFSDNVIAWLEPTAKCNLSCEGCYRANIEQHKTLEEIARDLDVFARYRKFDGVSIAGGDPLTHPQVADIVALVASRGHKPVLNTNGLALTEELLRELKKAGLVGLTFHIDSKQHRPGWKDKTELEMNELRLHFAEMVGRVGGLSCAFNATVYEDTLEHVPDLVQWAQDHIDLVQVMVFIAYREAVLDGRFDYYDGGEKIDPRPLVYAAPTAQQRSDINSPEVVAKIRERFPDFRPAAYLNGTEDPGSFKWLMAGRIGSKEQIHGYVGPRMMEAVQSLHHLFTGRYLAYAKPGVLSLGRSTMAAGALIDPGSRRAFWQWLKWVARNPLRLFRKQHFQSIMFIQPIDVLPDGRQSMCDGCPDITVDQGELVWSCRLEERLKYGNFLRTVPKEKPQARA
ncbi:MAG TPA: radical SAM protein [Myxococcales bacterium]|nr:radical SAM protein [Myxococcales bacterium]